LNEREKWNHVQRSGTVMFLVVSMKSVLQVIGMSMCMKYESSSRKTKIAAFHGFRAIKLTN
jgi:hypothetical protein